jgi:hypothetical protein
MGRIMEYYIILLSICVRNLELSCGRITRDGEILFSGQLQNMFHKMYGGKNGLPFEVNVLIVY